MDQTEILANLFDAKMLSILRFFMSNDKNEYYLREISKNTKVSVTSTFRILNKLVKMELLRVREIKTAKLYSLESNKGIDFLKAVIEVDILQQFLDRVPGIPGIEEILLLGAREKTKANLLVFGNNIDPNELKRLSAEIKEKHGFTLNYMTLTREQYEQMSAMGLYPGAKKSLYKRQ